MTDNFDWKDVEDDTVVESVSAMAVYFNLKGDVVIRQQGVYGISDDQVVFFPVRYLPSLIAKLNEMQRVADESEEAF